MSSSRLPGKNLLDLEGKPVLWHTVTRAQASKHAEEVIVATSTEKSDDATEFFCKENSFPVYRGSLDDVLKRYYECAREFKLDQIVRIGGASPLIDASVIDGMIEEFEIAVQEGIDYMGNVMKRVYPRGLDAEIFTFEALEKTWVNASTEEEHEHVTPYMRKYLKTRPYIVAEDLQGDFRLTIDEIDDYRIIREVYRRFYTGNGLVDMREVIRFLSEHPEIASINSHVEQKKVAY